MAPYLRLKAERHKRGWTQRDVAERVNALGELRRTVAQNDISDIERGRLIPTEAEINVLAHVFDIPPASVMKPCAIVDPDTEMVAS